MENSTVIVMIRVPSNLIMRCSKEHHAKFAQRESGTQMKEHPLSADVYTVLQERMPTLGVHAQKHALYARWERTRKTRFLEMAIALSIALSARLGIAAVP